MCDNLFVFHFIEQKNINPVNNINNYANDNYKWELQMRENYGQDKDKHVLLFSLWVV